jgi:phosphoglycolate phosphatase-like HAD superfamily hydrolase
MFQTMIEMISGKSEPTLQIKKEVEQYVEGSAGISTIEQMRHLETLVKKYHPITNVEILTAEKYKEIYDQRLLRVVEERLAMLENGNLSRQEVVVPGVIDFLDILKNLSLLLYIGSTTDRKYLLREAQILGVAHYFRDIFGPDTGLPNYSKGWLVQKILEWHNFTPDQLLAIGDGWVEIAETKKRGGFTVGVASTEKPSGKINEKKRKRLLEAGADVIIPDFSHWHVLASYLFGNNV